MGVDIDNGSLLRDGNFPLGVVVLGVIYSSPWYIIYMLCSGGVYKVEVCMN